MLSSAFHCGNQFLEAKDATRAIYLTPGRPVWAILPTSGNALPGIGHGVYSPPNRQRQLPRMYYQRPLVAFDEASVIAMLVQWGAKRLVTMQWARTAEPNVAATD